MNNTEFENMKPEVDDIDSRIEKSDIWKWLRGNCILSQNELILGEDVVAFHTDAPIENELLSLYSDLSTYVLNNCQPGTFYEGDPKRMVRKKEPDEQGKTLEQCLYDAIDYVLDKKASHTPLCVTLGNSIIDASNYALQASGDNEENFLQHCLGNCGGEWWVDILGVEKAEQLFKYCYAKMSK